MTPRRWQRVDHLFQAAVDLPPGDRAGYLREACRGDAALRREIQSLIDSHDQAGRFIEGAAMPSAEVLATQAACSGSNYQSRHRVFRLTVDVTGA